VIITSFAIARKIESRTLTGLAKLQCIIDRLVPFFKGFFVNDNPNAIELPPIKGHIRFEDAPFSYEKDRFILEDIELDAKPGETVALLGPTGSGKTTIIRLLSRVYAPQSGARASIAPYTELIIKNAMAILLKDRTSIVIAHRLSTVRNVYRILVIDNGKIIEEGNHIVLMKKSGLYRHLYEMQFKEPEGIVIKPTITTYANPKTKGQKRSKKGQ